jgi:hypothetical protein
MRRSSGDALFLIPQPEHSPVLIALALDGCHLPALALAQARHIRSRIVDALWSEVVGDEHAVRALFETCNTHSQALWWIQHKQEGKEVIKQQFHLLLSSLNLEAGGG